MTKRVLLSVFLVLATSIKANCPTPASPLAWQYGTGVGYEYVQVAPAPCWWALSIPSIGIAGDIDSAFNRYTYANQVENGSNVTFYYQGAGKYSVVALQVFDPLSCGTSVPAETMMGRLSGTNILVFASTYLYFGSNSGLGFPNNDMNASSFHGAVQKVMAHEIGHTMRLDDQPVVPGIGCGGQVAGQSVMNAWCGTNDSGNNLPSPTMQGLPACDNATIQ